MKRKIDTVEHMDDSEDKVMKWNSTNLESMDISDIESVVGARKFNFKLTDKKAVKNIIKSAQRPHFEIEAKQTCYNLRFSSGAYIIVAKKFIEQCGVRFREASVFVYENLEVKVEEFRNGHDQNNLHFDTKVVFNVNGKKVVMHCYNSTQNLKIDGAARSILISTFLEPLFHATIDDHKHEIEQYDRNVISSMASNSDIYQSLFKCEICVKEFNSYSELTKHNLLHNKVSGSVSTLQSLENTSCNKLFPKNALLCEDVTLEEESPDTCEEFVHDVSEIVLADDHTHSVSNHEQPVQLLESHVYEEQLVLDIHEPATIEVNDRSGNSPENTSDKQVSVKQVNVNKLTNAHIDCHKCNAKFDTDLELEWHLATDHENYEPEAASTSKQVNDTKIICDICSYEANTLELLQTHKHTNHTPYEHKGACQLCSYEAKNQEDLSLHIIENHAFQCKNCRMIFQSNELLELHMRAIHKAHVFKCHECDYCSENSKDLEEHIRDVHRSPKILEYLTQQQDALSHAFASFKVDLTEILKKIMDDNNEVKQELFILRKEGSQSNRFEKIEKQLQNIETTIRETGLVDNILNQRPRIQKPLVPQPGSQEHKVNQKSKPTFTFIGDAIGRNFEIKTVEEAVGGDIKIKRAFSSINDTAENEAKFGTKHPDKLIQNVLKDHDSNIHSDILVIQTGSVDITNLKTGGENAQLFSDYHRSHTISAAENLFKEVENTLVKYPHLKKAIILKQTPRFDKKSVDPYSVKPAMAKLFNNVLDKKWLESAHKSRLLIGNHRLECSRGSYETRYSNRRNSQYDGVHMYGPSGRKAYTESLLFILRQAGLLKKSPPQYFRRYHSVSEGIQITENEIYAAESHSRTYSVPTANRFNVLGQGN